MKSRPNNRRPGDTQGSDIESTEPLRLDLKSFDDMLPHVGDFGFYQWLLLISLIPYCFTYSVLYFGQFFITLVPTTYWCHVDGLGNLTIEERRNENIPQLLNADPPYETCHRWNDSSAKENSSLVSCTTWEYNLTSIPYKSLAAELDWVCDRSYLVSTAQSIFFCGSIVGGLLFGWLADHKGRIPALVICNGVGLLATVATAYANSFWSFAVIRFFAGLAFDNCINIPLIIVLEYVAVDKRSLVVNGAFGFYFALSSTILPWIAYFVADWRILCYVLAIPFLNAIVTPWILPESSRWYMTSGMSEKVVTKLKRIAQFNKKTPDPAIYDAFMANQEKDDREEQTATVLDLFKTRRLAKHTILVTLFWTLTALAFDGHVYSLKSLSGSVFVSFTLTSATELPAGILLILVLDRWGRRACSFVPTILTAVCSFLMIFIKTGIASLVVAVTARFLLNMAANVALQYAAEVLPTPARAQGVALVHIFGIIAHSMAPYVVEMTHIWDKLPMITLTLVSLVASILVLHLPETMGEDLPQTLQEGEDFCREQNFWSVPCIKKKSRPV
ncbi:carcinine transporter isoform X2 [Neodiprion lecontei]|uniref:Carcinine transporter isoform X2 n=1 Tax=Neodiprion lecontei TaxID=441921 RepID=A0ABM3G3U9_NEOLC|nr:carcinine transporter isoform X2 [Neodiprion lecontei]